MRMSTHSCQKMVTETSKTTSLFLLQHGFVLVTNSVHRYNIFLLESFYQAGKRNR